jgi:hypothetical protein
MPSIRYYRNRVLDIIAGREASCKREAARYEQRGEDHNMCGELGAASVTRVLYNTFKGFSVSSIEEFRLKALIVTSRVQNELNAEAAKMREIDRQKAANLQNMSHEARHIRDLILELDKRVGLECQSP